MKPLRSLDGYDVSRRSFLKTSGLALTATAFDLRAEEKKESGDGHDPRRQQPEVKPIDLVNLLQGTQSTAVFSRGNTLPIAAMPFGMAHWTIQSESGTPWMFQPGNRRIQGFRCTHQLSPWLSDYGHAVFLPFNGNPHPEAELRASSWRAEDATLSPYSIRLSLLRYQIDAELVPTERCAFLTAKSASNETPGLLVEIPGNNDEPEADRANLVIRFKSTANEGGVPANFAGYYVVQFTRAWNQVTLHPTPSGRVAMIRFGSEGRLEARIATSFISFEQAMRNLQVEMGGKTLDEVRAQGVESWEQYFGRIEVKGGTHEQRRTFYSCLYRALLFPRVWHEPDREGKPHHFSPYSGRIEPGVLYADHGYWDVYRAWYPFMSIVFPEKLAEILQAWVNAYHEGGWLPQFPAPGYRACMTGSLIDAVFGDAAAKGIRGFDLAAAYEGLKKHATRAGDPDRGYGRRGIEDYLRLGYVPADHVPQSVAETTDAAYGDFCIAQVARALGKREEAQMFLERSRNWRKLFDPTTGFLRGKTEPGAWLEPFDEYAWGCPYVEGSAWQHRWDAPHDIAGLIKELGGNAKAIEILNRMMMQSPVFRVGAYDREIHEMSEMAAVNFGQYAHSNQPVHHLLYIYAVAGRPDRTQYWVRRVMAELYSPDSFAGDEDTGSMAAWYLLSAFGFYPLCPGKSEYVLGSPLFDRITINLPGGKQTVLEAHGQSDSAIYVSKVFINGAESRMGSIAHDVIVGGSTVTFIMQSAPSVEGVDSSA